MLIIGFTVYTASVGDSRAILVSAVSKNTVFPAPVREINSAISALKQRRDNLLVHSLYHVQLTKDHKPEDKEESKRILQAGGRVSRLTDYEGNHVGPYRVWESEANVPGLTMSRSLGDSVAKYIGVTAVPDAVTYEIDPENDLFIVIGSDGIWDAMENDDVANFVEVFRERSCRTAKRVKEEPGLENVCIAQLLCEEARFRWLSIVEQDDVSIDDISCVVLEINKGRGVAVLNENRIVKRKSEVEEGRKEEMQVSGRVNDPKRASQIDIAVNYVKVE
jgi:serine/threonine protein phosphatase PrpC